MDFIKKNKLILGLIIVILLALGAFLVFNSTRSNNTQTALFEEEKEIKQLLPADIGLELSLRFDGKAVIIKATKVDGIKSLEYELTYDAQVSEEGEVHSVPRGAVGEIKIKGAVAQAEVDLGTCSANVCKYDKVVGSIKVVIKVEFENGEIGAVEDSISTEETTDN